MRLKTVSVSLITGGVAGLLLTRSGGCSFDMDIMTGNGSVLVRTGTGVKRITLTT